MTKITDSSATIVEKYQKVHNSNIEGSLQEKFEKLCVGVNDNKDVIEDVQNSLERLTLKENSKLIERGPQRVNKEVKVQKHQPYKQVSINAQQKVSSKYQNELHDKIQNSCNCEKLDKCSLCMDSWINISNSPNFEQLVFDSCKNIESLEVANIKAKNTLEPKIHRRSESLDSGFLSDASSSSPDSPLQPVVRVAPRTFRRVFPKNTIDTPKMCAKETLISTLNIEFKRKKYVEAVMNPDVYSVDENGLSVLHKVLRRKEPYLEETFYGLMERMKKQPKDCKRIVVLQHSIIEEMKKLQQDTSLLQSYFYEAIEFIQQKLNEK